jgi:amino acid adenylation domain-containing protein
LSQDYERTENSLRGGCVHQLFEAQVERTPEALAVQFEGQRLTYRELNDRANQLAGHLRSLGVGPETLVGICVERSACMVWGILGILKAGGAYVPMDSKYPAERLSFMVSDAAMTVIVTQQELAAPFMQSGARVVRLEEIPLNDPQSATLNPVSGVSPGNLAYMIYTSGSTGQPKGAMVTHQNVVRLFQATDHWFHFGPGDIWTLFHSVAFDFSVWELWGALLYGGRLVVVPYWTSRSPTDFYDLLVREKVTVLNQTPSASLQLAAAAERAPAAQQLNLRFVIFGGEALAPDSLKTWFDRFGDQKPQLINMYGITETTVHVTYRPMRIGDCHGPSVIGEPIPDLEVLLLDSNLQVVPVGITGEIHVGGAGLARGYWKRPELTRERFIQHPFRTEPEARLYKSGDLARYLPNGDLEYLGRADHQVKIRGFRIELAEIEARLREHPGVREAVVLVREDTPGDRRLVAYHSGPVPVKTDDLRRRLAERLPEYMVPQAYVRMESWPLTVNGKLDRKALLKPDPSDFAARASDESSEYVAPRTPVERQLVEIWERLLAVQPIGVRNNFFDLGGHSLLAVRLIWAVQETFGKTVAVAALFAAPTIERFARLLTEGESSVSLTETGKLRGSNSGTPLFHMPALTGVEFFPPALAHELGQVCPYCDWLQLVGVDGQQPPMERMEDIAVHVIAQIRRICPKGPYSLSGYSFGGVLGFEVARQLRAQGVEVESLILWDGFTSQAINHVRRSPLQALVELSSSQPASNGKVSSKLEWKHIKRQLIQKRTELVAALRPKETTMRVWKASMRAFEAYRPGPYTGSAVVVRASLPTESLLQKRVIPELNGWRDLIKGRIDLIEMPCDHADMWQEPMIRVLAEKTAEYIASRKESQRHT